MSNWHDVEQEYAKLDDEPSFRALPKGIVLEINGFAYWRTDRFVRRLPIEIYKARGKTSKPNGYYDAGPHSHKFNMSRRYTE
jgi:hypothetical protein